MLCAGELAARRVSKFEAMAKASARGTNFNFRLTSRIQVSCSHLFFAPRFAVLICRHIYSCYLSLSVCVTPLFL